MRMWQVAYARWLVTWGMELEDKKVRPSGSPPREGVLADLAHQLCAFPSHTPECKFATFYRCSPRPGRLRFTLEWQLRTRGLGLSIPCVGLCLWSCFLSDVHDLTGRGKTQASSQYCLHYQADHVPFRAEYHVMHRQGACK